MAFTTEFLTELGLDKDKVKEVMKEHGLVLNDTKQKLSDAEAERDSANSQIADITKQLDEAKSNAAKGSELETQVSDLQTQLKQAETDAQAKLSATKKDYEIDSALAKAGTLNNKAVKALIDTDKVSFEEGKLIGLSEQLEAVKAESEFLFESDQPAESKPGVQAFPNGNPSNGAGTPIDLSKMSYKEQVALKQENPEAYEQAVNTQGE